MARKVYRITAIVSMEASTMESVLTREDVAVQWEESEIKGDIGDAWVGLENCKETQKSCDDEERLSPDSNAQSTNIAGKMQPKHSKKEFSERVKDFNEEVPPKTYIGRQVWHKELKAVCRGEKLP